MTQQTSWLESTGVCGVDQNQAGGGSVQKRAQIECPVVGSLGQVTKSADLLNHGLQMPELSLTHHGLKG